MKSKEDLIVLTNVIRLLVTPEETDYEYAIFEENVPPLGGPPPHTHQDEEIFYILSGEFEFVLNDLNSPFKAQAGSVVHIPSLALHTYKNVGKTSGKMVVILSKGELIDYFRVIGNPVKNESEWPDLNNIPDMTKIDVKSVVEKGVEFNVSFELPTLFK
ncbi:cupin domain-containing protein [Paracrocinitomix mangrovi]|uniref:cupin domain-containing protein n=1 Tax=Paracrocinitomix mangrovi TaxID=2862509 RepID=UPI001C8DFBAC|nr:cupin domain-containing protein [Paracrocinitomix mangrovi]UKN02262.1 cupin domain-containing protein [Paracrocinitomix mangrovi]